MQLLLIIHNKARRRGDGELMSGARASPKGLDNSNNDYHQLKLKSRFGSINKYKLISFPFLLTILLDSSSCESESTTEDSRMTRHHGRQRLFIPFRCKGSFLGAYTLCICYNMMTGKQYKYMCVCGLKWRGRSIPRDHGQVAIESRGKRITNSERYGRRNFVILGIVVFRPIVCHYFLCLSIMFLPIMIRLYFLIYSLTIGFYY